jgi:hypothetical protein
MIYAWGGWFDDIWLEGGDGEKSTASISFTIKSVHPWILLG